MTLSEAIGVFGSISGIARIVGTTTQNVSSWKEKIPRCRQYELQVKSGGVLQADDFNDNLDYVEIANTKRSRERLAP